MCLYEDHCESNVTGKYIRWQLWTTTSCCVFLFNEVFQSCFYCCQHSAFRKCAQVGSSVQKHSAITVSVQMHNVYYYLKSTEEMKGFIINYN